MTPSWAPLSRCWEVARAALDLGFCISFSGTAAALLKVTVREVAQFVPEDQHAD